MQECFYQYLTSGAKARTRNWDYFVCVHVHIIDDDVDA
jgi:hypothetical protein